MGSWNVGSDDQDNDRWIGPAGTYRLVVAHSVEKNSKAGHPMWEMDLEVVAPAEINGRKTAGRRLPFWLVFIPPGERGHGMTKARLRALGYTVTENKPFDLTRAHAELIGKTIDAEVVDDVYQGQRQSKINNIFQPGSVPGSQPAPHDPIPF